ncbi:MAG: hypothetical protein GTN40_04320 [Candidatus Aenigmarchaeota archaeon]|nr:hypothetical protein [Candidatus Aenigmarchaeota archaeon]
MKPYLFLFIIIFLICLSNLSSAVVEITIEYGEEACIENWDCTDWSECVGGTQTRTCTDLNDCGTTYDAPDPFESRSCTVSSPGGPGGPGSPGGPTIGGDITPGDVTTSEEPEPEIPPEPELKESPYIQLELSTIDEIEAGEPFTVNVTISSTISLDTTIELLKVKQNVVLEAGESKILSFEVHAPETEGSYNLVALTPYATGNKTIYLYYKPLFLYVIPKENQSYEIHLKNFDNTSSTELQIVKDDFQTVYLDYLDGKIDYKVNLTFTKPGNYKVKAKALSGSILLDEDERVFEIKGMPTIDYSLPILVAVVIIILIFSILIFKEKFKKVS